MNKLIAVTIGDIQGIGIEILINIFKTKNEKNFVLFTNFKIIKSYLDKQKINIKVNVYNNNNNKFKKNYLNIYSFTANSNEENSIKSIKYSYHFETKKKFHRFNYFAFKKRLNYKKNK